MLTITLMSFAGTQASTANNAAEINHLSSDALQQQGIPAMTVALSIDGNVVYSKGFGTADIEHAVAANSDTLIRTGSLAKPITAVAAMTLVESGKLDLDAPVQKYCPRVSAEAMDDYNSRTSDTHFRYSSLQRKRNR
jgi:CubicO group peptidase (beta-lactamase class C family)